MPKKIQMSLHHLSSGLLVVPPQSNLLTSCLCFSFLFFFFALWHPHPPYFSRQAQNCHILDLPLMMEGFLCCCCSSACHCEEKKPSKLSLLPPGFAISHVEDPVSCFWENNGVQSWPQKMRLPLYKQWHEEKERRRRHRRVTIDLASPYREAFFSSSPLVSSHRVEGRQIKWDQA